MNCLVYKTSQRLNGLIEFLLYTVLGIIIGMLSTLAGIGGGVFMVPLFYFLGMSISSAVGTSKFVIVFLSLVGAINYLRSGRVLVKVSLLALIGMMPFSYIGAYLSVIVGKTMLRIIVGLFIVFYGGRLLYVYLHRRFSRSGKTVDRNIYRDIDVKTKWPIVIAIGCFSGFIAGLTGTGGGIINMPLFLSVLRIPIHYAIATSTFIIFPAAVTAAIRHVIDGEVVYGIAIPFIIGSIVGANLGPRIALSLKPQQLRLFVGIILLFAGIRMLIS